MKNTLNHYKNNNGPNLNKQNSQLLNLSLATAGGKYSIYQFSFSVTRNVVTEYVTFGFLYVFWFSFPSIKV